MLDNIFIKYLITFFLGMMPIIEIRGAIPVGVGLGLSYIQSFAIRVCRKYNTNLFYCKIHRTGF